MERERARSSQHWSAPGLAYLSDEAVAIDPDTRLLAPYRSRCRSTPVPVVSFPELEPRRARRPSRRTNGRSRLRTSAALGTRVPSRDRVPAYSPNAETELIPIVPAEALVELTKNTFAFKERRARILEMLAEVARSAECYRFPIGELRDAVDRHRASSARTKLRVRTGRTDLDVIETLRPDTLSRGARGEIDGEAVLLDQAPINSITSIATARSSGPASTASRRSARSSDLSNEFGQGHAEVLRDTVAITTQLADEGLLRGTTPVRWQRRDDADWRRTLDQVVVLAQKDESPCAISGSGSTLWSHLARASTVRASSRLRWPNSTTPMPAIAADLRPLLDDLERRVSSGGSPLGDHPFDTGLSEATPDRRADRQGLRPG